MWNVSQRSFETVEYVALAGQHVERFAVCLKYVSCERTAEFPDAFGSG